MSRELNFNQVKETHLKTLAQYVPVVAIVHGGNHPEFYQVRKVYDELAKKAKEFGHKAVAVTDYGVAHAYPFAFKESSDDFKVIFGLEAYVVDDEQEMITRPKDKNIEEEIYVVFDIETTGFDPYNDKIRND